MRGILVVKYNPRYHHNSENSDCQEKYSDFYNFVNIAQSKFSDFVKKE